MEKDKLTNEQDRLNNIAQDSIYAAGMGEITIKYSGKIFERFMVTGSVLELGPAEGVMTECLWEQWKKDYTVVDGSEMFIAALKQKYEDINAQVSLFEEYKPERKFKNIILGHVLEHVIDPVEILKLCSQWLEEDGVILAAVPNKDSLHRQAAVIMGLLSSVTSFSEKDYRHGHRRVFGYDSFYQAFIDAGLNVKCRGGYWLKPLADYQIEQSWSRELIDAYMQLGEKYPTIAGELYIVADNKKILE